MFIHVLDRRFSQHFALLDEAEEPGAPQGAERDAWSDRCCGLASLRTVLDAHGLAVPTQTALLRRSIAVGAIAEAGMIHCKVVELAAGHGLDGRAVLLWPADGGRVPSAVAPFVPIGYRRERSHDPRAHRGRVGTTQSPQYPPPGIR